MGKRVEGREIANGKIIGVIIGADVIGPSAAREGTMGNGVGNASCETFPTTGPTAVHTDVCLEGLRYMPHLVDVILLRLFA